MAHSLRRRARRCSAVSGLRKYRRLPMVTLLGLVLSGCQTSGNLALTEADEAAIREGVGTIVAAANRATSQHGPRSTRRMPSSCRLMVRLLKAGQRFTSG